MKHNLIQSIKLYDKRLQCNTMYTIVYICIQDLKQSWENGKSATLETWSPQGRAGSNPADCARPS